MGHVTFSIYSEPKEPTPAVSNGMIEIVIPRINLLQRIYYFIF